MKVANFTDTYVPHVNGVATTLYEIHHAKKTWKDELFGPIDHPDVNKVSGVPFPIYPEYKIALDTGKLRKGVEECDVIHSHTPYGMFYYGWKMAGELDKPFIGTFHTDPAAVFGALIAIQSFWGRPATKITWGYLVGLYNRCDKVIAVSGWLERELKSRGLKKPIETIPNGVDIKRFNPDVNYKKFKEMYKLPDKPIVLFMGRLQHKKDPETLVRAAMHVKTDATFIISGHGELEEKLKNMARKNPNIIFPGFLPKKMVTQAYAAADIFVFPSEMETQGIVLLEAMACNTACISTDVGVARDVVGPDYIVKQKDAKGIAKRIDELLANNQKRKKIAKDGRRLIEQEFSMEAMLKKLGELYEREVKQ